MKKHHDHLANSVGYQEGNQVWLITQHTLKESHPSFNPHGRPHTGYSFESTMWYTAVVFNLGYAKTSKGVRKIKKYINILFHNKPIN
jgi:hypothetical protein